MKASNGVEEKTELINSITSVGVTLDQTSLVMVKGGSILKDCDEQCFFLEGTQIGL